MINFSIYKEADDFIRFENSILRSVYVFHKKLFTILKL